MNNDGDKKKGRVRVIIAFFLLMSMVLGVWTFYVVKSLRPSGSIYVFDGWTYGREDQKKASAALAEAGLTDFAWRDGKLLAPADKKGEFQKALAGAGAYPKAPSELRVDAVREMNVFESESKTRFRELNACAQQLERTIEQMRGVEYATVGVRSRREQVGLVAKNIITASVGVACVKDHSLDVDALSAITVATKHQLGIDDVANISIIDLREGKSYFGVENAVDSGDEAELVVEKEKIEKYWRDKYLEAFSDIKNLRVSVVADVVFSTELSEEKREDDKITETSKSPILSTSFTDTSPKVKGVFSTAPRPLVVAHVDGRFETLDNPVGTTLKDHESDEERGSQETLDESHCGQNKKELVVVEPSKGFALLGNPDRTNASPIVRRKPKAKSQTENEDKNSFDTVALKAVTRFHWVDGTTPVGTFPVFSPFLSDEQISSGKLKFVVEDAVKDVVNYSDFDSRTRRFINNRCKENDEFKLMNASRQIGDFTPVALEERVESSITSPRLTTLRSIAVYIAVPRSYLRNVAFHRSDSPETFADDHEVEVLSEIKKFAIDLFRPTGERFGWTDREFERWFVVSTFYDVDEAGNNDFSSNDVAPKFGSSHSAAYVEKPNGDIVAKYGDGFPLSFDITSKKDFTSSDQNGRVAEIAQTAASGVETIMNAEEGETQFFQSLVTKVLPIWRMAESYAQNPTYRNIGAGILVSILILVWIIIANHKKQTTRRAPDQPIKGKYHTDKKATDDSRRFRTEGAKDSFGENPDGFMSELSEFDDELEGELQKIAAKRNVSEVTRPQNSASKFDESDSPSKGYWNKRREALEVVARYPERAAATLQNWVKDA